MFFTIVVFILVLSLLVFVHEFGHFFVAKKSGVKVEEFGFGLPPRIFGIKKGETIYSINALPIGGFVKIYGEDGEQEPSEEDSNRAFFNKPATTRALILLAGVTMNLVLAAVLLSLGFWLGLPASVTDDSKGDFKNAKIQINQVAPNSPAEEAGIQMGDSVKKLVAGGQTLVPSKIEDVQNFIDQNKGREITIIFERGDKTLEKKIVPRKDPPENEGHIGVSLAKTAIVSYPWYQAIAKGFFRTYEITLFIIVAFVAILWDLITTGTLDSQVAGPVGIFKVTGQAAQLGFIYLLQFTAILSINLAILNAIPFPALDGGKLLFLAIEKIKGSPVNRKFEQYAHTAGFVFLILLIIAVTWRDIVMFF